MNKMNNHLLKYAAVALILVASLMGKASIAYAVDADCTQSNQSGAANTTNQVNLGSSVSVPYSMPIDGIFATGAWTAPSGGLNNPSVIILQCRSPGDIRVNIVANQTDPTPRGTPGFLETWSGNVNVRFTLGTDTSDSTKWMSLPSPGNTFTLTNAIPNVADIGGGPLNPSLGSSNFSNQPAGTYNLTLARLLQLLPLTVTGELQKQSALGSASNFGGANRVSLNLLFTNWGYTNYSLTLAVFQLPNMEVVAAPCDPVILSNPVVDLGQYLLSYFTGVGTTTANVPIPVTISCPAMVSGGSVYYGFETDYPDSTSQDLIGNMSGAGNATGVAVELVESDGTTRHNLLRPNDLNTNWTNSNITTSNTSANLMFYARMRQTQSTVTVGAINTIATFVLNYK